VLGVDDGRAAAMIGLWIRGQWGTAVAVTGANLHGATGTPETTDTNWSNTTCPDGTNSDQNGNTRVGHFLP
jgi:hypothetical protein